MSFLDLPEDFKVLKEVEEDSIIYYYIEPKDKNKKCKHCGSNQLNSNGYLNGYRHIRDTNYKGKLVGFMVKSPRYICKSCKKSFTHIYESFPERKGMTYRLIRDIGEKGLSHSYQEVAERYGLERQNIEPIVREHKKYLDNKNKQIIKTPKKLAVLSFPMLGENRLFLFDLDLDAIIDIQSEISYGRLTKATNLMDIRNIQLVLAEADTKLNKWLDLNIRKFTRVLYGPSVINALEEEFRRVYEVLTKDTSFSLEGRNLNSDSNRKIIRNASNDIPKLQNYLNFYLEITKSCKNECGRYKNIAIKINEEFSKNNLDLSKEFFEDFSHYISAIERYDVYSDKWDKLYNQINTIINGFQKEGYGYSYKMLRAKILYGTPATKKPKYKAPNPSSHGMGHMTFTTPELISGFHVSINELLEYIEQN